jgi:hypothetical protein
MSTARYQLPLHPTLSGPHTKQELYLLAERGSLGRGEIVLDRISGRSHKVGELIGGMRPPREEESAMRLERPSYQEISGDTPWELGQELGAEPFGDELEADVEEELGDEEEIDDLADTYIHYHGHPSWLSFTKPLLLSLLLLGCAIAAIQFGGKYFIIGLALSSLIFCCTIIARQHRDYYVSGERVEAEWGIIGRSSKEVRIVDIRSMDVHESGLLGFLGIGSLDVSSAGSEGVEVQFRYVRKPHRIKELIRQLQSRLED